MQAPGKGLLLAAGLLHICFSLGSIAVALVEISVLSYSDIPLLSLPDRLPNISWIGHYWLLSLVGAINFAVGVLAIKHHRSPKKARFLLVVSATALAVYIVFVLFSAHDEANLRGGLWVFWPAFFVPVLCIIGAVANLAAYKMRGKG